MKKFFCFLSIFAILFFSFNLTPNFKNNAEFVDATIPSNSFPYLVYSVYSDIYVYSSAFSTINEYDTISIGGLFAMPSGVSAYTNGVQYTGASLNSYVNITFSHYEDTALPPNDPPDTFTHIEYLSGDTVDTALVLIFNDFFFSDNIDPMFYGQISYPNTSAETWSGSLDVYYTSINSYGDLVDDVSHIQILNQPVDTPLSIASLLTSITNDVVYVRNMSISYNTFENPYSTSDFELIFKTNRTSLENLDFDSDFAFFSNPLFVQLQKEFVSQRDIEITTPFDWLTNSLDSFVNMEIFPNFSISSVLGIVFGFCFLVIILKVFFGG